jgi:hypothetical protein
VSCASKKNKRTHGGVAGPARARWYRAWEAAKRRCTNPKDPAYPRYGGRGIRMCARWLDDPSTFLADMGKPEDGACIERVDNNGDYEPSNCVWADATAQARNRESSRLIDFRGETMTLAEWGERTGLRPYTISMRLDRYGWSVERALTTPVAPHRRRGITFRGKTQGARAWAKETGIPRSTILDRLKRGMSVEEALTTPPERRGRGSPNWRG